MREGARQGQFTPPEGTGRDGQGRAGAGAGGRRGRRALAAMDGRARTINSRLPWSCCERSSSLPSSRFRIAKTRSSGEPSLASCRRCRSAAAFELRSRARTQTGTSRKSRSRRATLITCRHTRRHAAGQGSSHSSCSPHPRAVAQGRIAQGRCARPVRGVWQVRAGLADEASVGTAGTALPHPVPLPRHTRVPHAAPPRRLTSHAWRVAL